MLSNLVHAIEKVTAVILTGIAVSTQIGNVLVCLFALLVGPAFLLGLLNR